MRCLRDAGPCPCSSYDEERIRHALWVVPLRTFRCVLSPAHPPFSFTVYFAFTDTGWLEFSDAFPSRPAV